MIRTTLMIVLLANVVSRAAETAEIVDYNSHIKPILSSRCYNCHGVLQQQSGLRLETRNLMIRGGESGAVIQPGNSDDSLLVARITAGNDERMPPAGEGQALDLEEIELIRRWIDQGAPAPDEPVPADPRDHWAFRPLTRPELTSAADSAWVRNPLDAFIAERHEQAGLTPQLEAPREILLRRLYLDLIGLPPTANEILAARHDESVTWYQRTVDRLLADPRHGQRWARHWMDIWRYSDWIGFRGRQHGSQQHIWHWRDWIVESINDNVPYDERIRLMLAADELRPNDLHHLRATGYLARNWILFNRNQWLDEVVEHVSKGFLGLTINCAKCHDHKYDPISQRDYYAMRAIFEPYHVRLDIVPGQPDLDVDAIPRVYDGSLDQPTYLFVRGDENRPDTSTVIAPGVPANLAFRKLAIQPVSLPLEAWQPARRPWVFDSHLTAARTKMRSAKATWRQLVESNEDMSNGERALQDRELNSAEIRVAERALDLARAELVSVKCRADAMRDAWNEYERSELQRRESRSPPNEPPQPIDYRSNSKRAITAIRAEQQVAVASARKALAVAELELLRSSPEKRPECESTRNQARKSLAQAERIANAPLKKSQQFTPIQGARWSATRFFQSTQNDPDVPFTPQSTGRRTALARWITDSQNPLTARVAVNHLWARHMDAPLVASVFDFGRHGSLPSHPELLDWLAATLVESGWSMKHMHRLIVNTSTYRLSSSVADAASNVERDPDNRYWWRRRPLRLEAQAVRDSILAHAGTLDCTPGGPSIPVEKQESSRRRGLYFFHSENERNRFLTIFDDALAKECYQRESSIRPQQALALANSRLVLDSAPQIVRRLSEGISDDEAFIRKAFVVLLGMNATDAEVAVSRQAMDQWRNLSGSRNDKARERLIWALINHNDFVTLR